MKNSPALKCILLIDDDQASNFYHQALIEDLEIDARVQVCQSAKHALEYLSGKSMFTEFMDNPLPDLILLDLYMPGMDGWDFLEEYNKLSNIKNKAVIAVISSSGNPQDKDKANKSSYVEKYISKTSNTNYIKELIKEYYAGNLMN